MKSFISRFAPVPVVMSVLLGACTGSSEKKEESSKPLTEAERHLPENAIRGLKVADGLEATLFAHEPMLVNPTNIDIDEKGRVWVCEAYNYRNQLNPQNPVKSEGDRILILEDTNGDGTADKQTVFYQGTEINAPLGIAVLGNKVIVSCSPNVFVFTDENGDGKADKKETLFTGIGGIQHDHAIHAFNFGPDGKLYFNFGNAGDSIENKEGKVIRDPEGNIVRNDGKPYRQGMVFRCNPDGSEFEVLANNFRNNYEVAEDSYGTMWQSDNDDDGNRGVRINYVMPYGNYGYTDEITGAGWHQRRVNMEDSIPYRHWHLNDPGVVPNLLQTGAGSPTGMVIYEGDLLPEKYRNQMIHADAGPNVVRSYAVEPDGAGYKATINNIVEGTGDNWFRPSDVCIAPDGSLFIADWYDPGVGGHQVADLDRGRIFRIAPTGSKYSVPSLNLDNPDNAVKALQSPNIATRYLAWQKLHSWDTDAIPALEKLYRSNNSRFRARALWLLGKIPGKGFGYVTDALKDKDDNIRITALRIALETKADTTNIVKQLINDPSAQVRREAAIALRHNKSAEAPALWAQLAKQYDGKDRWYLEALGIGADKQWDTFFPAWLAAVNNNWNTNEGRDIVWRARTPQTLPLLVQIVSNPEHNPDNYLKFYRAFDFQPGIEKEKALRSLLEGHHPQQDRINSIVLMLIDETKVPMTPAFKNAIASALNSVKGTQDYVDLVSRYKLRDKNNELLQIIEQSNDKGLQTSAIRVLLSTNNGDVLVKKALEARDSISLKIIKALGGYEDKKSKDILQAIVLDTKYPADLRNAAIESFSHGWSGEDRLLALAKENKLPEDVKPVAVKILSTAYRGEIKKEAAKYLNISTGPVNKISPVAQLVTMHGDATAGATVFTTYCATCHQVNNKGTDFGPKLSEIGSKLSKEAIYTSIMEPSAGISFGFEGYSFKLKNGTQLLGYISSKTNDEITIKMIGGAEEKHAKSDIVEQKAYDKSLMPEGLAQGMGEKDLVNLVEYLTTLKKKN